MTAENAQAEILGPGSDIVAAAPGQVPAQPITPMQMLQIAVEKGTDIEQLSKLMDLNDRYEANLARKAFVVAKAAFKAEAPVLTKNKHVGFDSNKGGARTDYHHTTLDHAAGLLSPVLSKHGLTYSWETEQAEGGLIRVTCVLTHVQGHAERVTLQAGPDSSGNKNNIQAVGSTVTYLERYTLLSALGMATGDMDTDGIGPVDLIDAKQKETLVGLMKETGADTGRFLKFLGVTTLDELPEASFGSAKVALEAKRTARKEEGTDDENP